MIPLHDDIPSARVPVVNYALIVVNVLVFLYELSLGPGIDAFFHQWAVIPRELTHAWPQLRHGVIHLDVWLSVLTAMFLHGGWLHLLGNMLTLWIFGDNVEGQLGHLGYLVFYLAAGILATALQVFVSPLSTLPSLGASGAIAGVLGFYLILFPDARVLTLVPIGFFLTTIRVSALIYLLLWFAMQAIQGIAALAPSQANVGGVAWWAHIGGFLFGLVIGALNRGSHRPPPRNPYADRWYSNR
ncbi:MAG TPA: rhomboid family intramembrane serine protease [Stenomitos sp.]